MKRKILDPYTAYRLWRMREHKAWRVAKALALNVQTQADNIDAKSALDQWSTASALQHQAFMQWIQEPVHG